MPTNWLNIFLVFRYHLVLFLLLKNFSVPPSWKKLLSLARTTSIPSVTGKMKTLEQNRSCNQCLTLLRQVNIFPLSEIDLNRYWKWLNQLFQSVKDDGHGRVGEDYWHVNSPGCGHLPQTCAHRIWAAAGHDDGGDVSISIFDKTEENEKHFRWNTQMWIIEYSLTRQGMSGKEEVRMIDIHTGIAAENERIDPHTKMHK